LPFLEFHADQRTGQGPLEPVLCGVEQLAILVPDTRMVNSNPCSEQQISTVRPALHMSAMANGHASLQARTVP
jgi:hypothetical protein